MKRIKLIHITFPDLSSHYIKQRMYSVTLGNKVNKWFSNRKDAVRFLVYINSELNRKLNELNYIYGFILSEYRKIWCYLEDSDKEGNIESQIKYINHGFKMACERSQLTNGNHFVFKNLSLIIEGLNEFCKMLIEQLQERNFYVDMHRIEVFQTMLRLAQQSIDTLGKDFVFERPEARIDKNL